MGVLVLSIRTKPCFAKEKRASAKSPKSSVLLESHLPSSVSIGIQSSSLMAALSSFKSHCSSAVGCFFYFFKLRINHVFTGTGLC